MECLSCGDQLSCLTQQTNAPEKALEKSAGKNGTSAGKPPQYRQNGMPN